MDRQGDGRCLPGRTALAAPSGRLLLLLLLLLAVSGPTTVARPDMNDADQADAESDTSGTSDIDSMKDMNDPNILNPQRGQGYGNLDTNPPWRFTTTTPPPRTKVTTTPRPTFTQQSMTAVLEFGIIVGVAFMVGGMFMAMVGMEILYDKMIDKYHEVFKKPKPLPDVERLHPAELVGTFSRYK